MRYVETRFGEHVAERVLREFESALERLASASGVGHRRHDLTDDERVRFWSVGPALLAYRAVAQPVEILFVERGELDWASLLAHHVR